MQIIDLFDIQPTTLKDDARNGYSIDKANDLLQKINVAFKKDSQVRIDTYETTSKKRITQYKCTKLNDYIKTLEDISFELINIC